MWPPFDPLVAGCMHADTEQDVDESRYRIALRCRDAHKLNRDAEVECTISGSQ